MGKDSSESIGIIGSVSNGSIKMRELVDKLDKLVEGIEATVLFELQAEERLNKNSRRLNVNLFPFNGSRRLRTNIINDSIYSFNLINNVRTYFS
jgi:hypothetical protein